MNYGKGKYLALTILLIAVIALGAYAAALASENGAYRKITPDEGRAMMDEGVAVVLDVRRSEEYKNGHIPGAINLPNENITNGKPEILTDTDETIIVYCRTGVRSKQAADKLVNLGYTNVNDMGGIVDWPYETVEGDLPGEYAETLTERGVLSRFAAYDIDGNKVDQSILKDYKLTMINVWATFCGPCLSEMPELGEVAREYADKGVQIIGLVGDTLDSDGKISKKHVKLARKQVKQTKADYTHLVPSEDLYAIMYQIDAYPTSFFVDDEGKQVGTAYVGSMDKEMCVGLIEEALTQLA